MSGPRRWREEGLGEDGVGNSIREVACNDPGKSLWGFRQEATEDFLKSDFSGAEGGDGQYGGEKDEWRGNEGGRPCVDVNY